MQQDVAESAGRLRRVPSPLAVRGAVRGTLEQSPRGVRSRCLIHRPGLFDSSFRFVWLVFTGHLPGPPRVNGALSRGALEALVGPPPAATETSQAATFPGNPDAGGSTGDLRIPSAGGDCTPYPPGPPGPPGREVSCPRWRGRPWGPAGDVLGSPWQPGLLAPPRARRPLLPRPRPCSAPWARGLVGQWHRSLGQQPRGICVARTAL